LSLYQFHDTVVLRHPVYSFKQFSENGLAAKLKDSYFQDAIYLCSPTVFDELKKCNFEYDRLSSKLKNTLLKYFNRMCYRPTPFALCAAVSAVKWADSGNGILLNAATFKPHVKLSYGRSLKVAAEMLPLSQHQLKVKANATLYKTGKQLRYIKCLQEDADKITFYIASADATMLLNKVLSYTATTRSLDDILTFTAQKAGCSINAATEYLQTLLSEQILVDAGAPNITGRDYLDKQHLSIPTNDRHEGCNLFQGLKTVVNTADFHGYLDQYGTSLQKNDLYVNLESTIENGNISSVHQKAISDGLTFLAHFNQSHVPKGINQFAQQFNKKFEGQTVPLLLALDPEVGVGYIALTAGSEPLNFADDIAWDRTPTNSDALDWGQLQSLILKKWMAEGKYEPINLSATDLNTLDQSGQEKLPSTLSVVFRLAGEKVLIEQVAGVTATSLIGRFTPVNTEIDALARNIASLETDSNPGLIYAEIVHICHKQTANIDRRNHIYPYEIVTLTPSTLADRHQILLSDLYVSVRNNEIILWSAKHGKRVIPRLSSAFNYQRDDLAAFRFLCDLQHVGVQTNFNFAIENLYPGLDFYPRVEFEQAVLQCAQWYLNNEVVASLVSEKDKQKRLAAFGQLRQQLQLCKYVALTQHDHQLIFNLDDPADVCFLLETIQPMEKVVIKEVLVETINKPLLFNEKHEGVTSQFIATLYHNQAVYQPKAPDALSFKKQPVRKFLPGSEWLYFKLYSHQARTNEIIGRVIHKMINRGLKEGWITQWFFTRYNDPDHHIRLRIKVSPGNQQIVIKLFNQAVNQYLNEGLLSNVNIDTYCRELERYPNIDVFESIFYHSSNWISSYLNCTWTELTQNDCLSFAFLTTRTLLKAAGFSSQERLDYLTSIVKAFSNEFSEVPDLKYQLDITYRKYKDALFRLKDTRSYYAHYKLGNITGRNSNIVTAYFKQILTLPLESKYKHLSDIIHMHLNRIFADRPREQEFTLYWMLLKYEKSSKYLNQGVYTDQQYNDGLFG
jgi:thiopeptide-type bacteriocin biosynthesis protein